MPGEKMAVATAHWLQVLARHSKPACSQGGVVGPLYPLTLSSYESAAIVMPWQAVLR